MAVQFREGKGVLLRDLYTVHTSIPLSLAQELSQYMQTLGPDEYLIPQRPGLNWTARMPRMLAAVRRIDPSLSLRSLRRGSLQAMAMAGVSVDTLLTYSGHTTQRMLMRYLDWSRQFGRGRNDGQAAAAALLPSQH